MSEPSPSDGGVRTPAPDAPEPVDREQLDAAVAAVARRKHAWPRLSLDERIELLGRCMQATYDVAEAWGRAGREAKATAGDPVAEVEDLANGPMVLVRNLRLLRETLTGLRDHGSVPLPGEPAVRPDGQVTVPVFPTGVLDNALFAGHRAHVWLEPDVEPNGLRTAVAHREPPAGRLCFVLGAGNVSSIGAMDALTKLVGEQQVVVLKMNPVNAYAGPYVEQALAPLIDAGFLRVVYGGAETGQYLIDHPEVDTVHVTGSDATHDRIVFGAGQEGRRRRERGEVALDKPITSELGNVTPIIVVPGPWSAGDLAYQGKHLATMLTQNAGFNCAAGRLVITHDDWSRRDDLLDALRAALGEAPQRAAYYPGARERWERFTAAHPDAEAYGTSADGAVPWTLLPGLDPAQRDDPAFRVECFNGIIGDVPFDAPRDIPTFLEQAVAWCNETLWGNLAASILVHPRSLKDPAVAMAVDRAVAELRYGSVAVNAWAAMVYGLVSPPWGAFPGNPLSDIQSGRGVVHNTYLLEDTQKSVLYAPFRLGRKPPASYDFSTLPSLVRRLLALEAHGDWKQLPGIAFDGIRA